MRSPYEVYEKVNGKYNPDIPPTVVYSVWFGEQKAEWLKLHPGITLLDGNIFYERDLHLFFDWLDKKFS